MALFPWAPLSSPARWRAVSAPAELVKCLCKGGDGVRQLIVPRCLAAHRLQLVSRVQQPRTPAAAVQQQDLVTHCGLAGVSLVLGANALERPIRATNRRLSRKVKLAQGLE